VQFSPSGDLITAGVITAPLRPKKPRFAISTKR
jgi:hypothetical protein